jgi:hypothetical protein
MKELRLRSRKPRLTAVQTPCADHATPLYSQKLTLTSPISDGRSFGIIHSPTKGYRVYNNNTVIPRAVVP